MRNLGSRTIDTGRLLLRKKTVDDAQMMFENWASDEKVAKCFNWPVHTEVETTRRILAIMEQTLANDDCYQWGIVCKDNNEMIGTIGVSSIDYDKEAFELMFCVGSKFWGHGYASEALNGVLDFLFNQVDAKVAWASHGIDNIVPGKVMRKCGLMYFRDSFKLDSHHSEYVFRDYKITKEEYLTRTK